jgi:hypothetical protein
VSASTTHGSPALHFAHRGVPLGMGPTRLRAPHDGQAMIAMPPT